MAEKVYHFSSSEILNDKDFQELCMAVASLHSKEEAMEVLVSILAPQEIETLKKRWQILKMISKDTPYRVIAKNLKVSTTTVTRTALSLKREKTGWELLMRSLEAQSPQEQK